MLYISPSSCQAPLHSNQNIPASGDSHVPEKLSITVIEIVLARLFPAKYKMLWPDIAMCSNKSGWHGQGEFRHCGERLTYSYHLTLGASLQSLHTLPSTHCSIIGARLTQESLTRNPKENLVQVWCLRSSSANPSSGDKPASALAWIERQGSFKLRRRHRSAWGAKRGKKHRWRSHGVLCSLRTVKGCHLSLSAS